jgi:hypothetical protein
MDRIIVGSSNVYRFYRPELYKDYKAYNVVRCTDIITFKAVMENMAEGECGVVVSVLENFLERSIVGETEKEAVLSGLGETMLEFMRIIKTTASRLPKSKFIIAEPIKRPKNESYQANFENILTAFGEGFEFAKKDNITKMEGIPEGCQQFEPDGVHLTADSGQIFIEGLLSKAEIFFSADLVNLEEEEIIINDESSITDNLTLRLDRLEAQVKTRQMEDNLIFARIREEMDATTNKAKEDKVVITGITSNVYPPTDLIQKKLWLRNIVEDVIKSVAPDCTGKIVFVNQGKNNGKIIPLVEVKMDSILTANQIRKAFAEKKKSGSDMGRIFIANSVNLATRVRVDILKALARKVTDQHLVAYAIPFVSRPVMQVRSKDGGSISDARSFSFTDAVAKYGHLLKQFELADAYRRAGDHFKGQLEQQFIVLKERRDEGRGSAGPSVPHHRVNRQPEAGSRKRGREEDEYDGDWSRESPARGRGHSRGQWRGSGSGTSRPYRGKKFYRR